MIFRNYLDLQNTITENLLIFQKKEKTGRVILSRPKAPQRLK